MKNQMTYPANACALTYTYDGYTTQSVNFAGVFKRLFSCLALIPRGNSVALQLQLNSESRYGCWAARDTNGLLTAEDVEWILSGNAVLDKSRTVLLKDPFAGNGLVYALCTEALSDRETDEMPSTRAICELMRELKEENAKLRLVAFCGGDSRNTDGVLLLCLPKRMSLRLQAMLNSFFPACSVKLLLKDEEITTGTLTPIAARFGLLLSEVLRVEKAAAPRRDDTDSRKSAGFTPLETLELSVRGYNILRRNGIDSVEALCATDDADLLTMRNMTHSTFEDIKEKLDAYLNAPQIEFLDDELYDLLPDEITAEEKTDKKEASPDYFAMLGELIGLDAVKEQVRRIAAFARLKKAVTDNGGDDIPMTLNMQFVGSPGTAKTTVARIMAGILYQAGLLESDKPVEVGRADLVAKYVGHTADRVKEVFGQAEGRLLFIDEAYSLLERFEGSYGDEAINTIVQEMENRRSSTVVVFAGYGKEMEKFFARNPGLRSRVPFKIVFNDYTCDEMAQITALQAKQLGFTVRPDAMEKIRSICEKAAKQEDFGNGRFCRTLAERAVLAYAGRICGNADADTLPVPDMVLLPEDFPEPQTESPASPRRVIGF